MVKVRVDGARRSRKPEERGKEPENTPKTTKGIRKEPKGNPGGTGVTQEKSLYKTGKGAAPGE